MALASQPRILFMATSGFALPSFSALLENGYTIVACVTKPDAPVGRRQVLLSPPIKTLAKSQGIPVYQPQSLKHEDAVEKIKAFTPDLIIVASYGKIIPMAILGIPTRGAINIHPSLLPQYRGPSPIQTVILQGESITGVTLILLDELMDHGPILAAREVPIQDNDTFLSLHDVLASIAAQLLIDTLPLYLAGEIIPQPQDETKVSISKMIQANDRSIDLTWTTHKIWNHFHAFITWPGTCFSFKGRKLKIKNVLLPSRDEQISLLAKHYRSGELFFSPSNKLYLKTIDGYLQILAIQPEGRRVLTDVEFIHGYLIH